MSVKTRRGAVLPYAYKALEYAETALGKDTPELLVYKQQIINAQLAFEDWESAFDTCIDLINSFEKNNVTDRIARLNLMNHFTNTVVIMLTDEDKIVTEKLDSEYGKNLDTLFEEILATKIFDIDDILNELNDGDIENPDFQNFMVIFMTTLLTFSQYGF